MLPGFPFKNVHVVKTLLVLACCEGIADVGIKRMEGHPFHIPAPAISLQHILFSCQHHQFPQNSFLTPTTKIEFYCKCKKIFVVTMFVTANLCRFDFCRCYLLTRISPQ